MGAMKIDSKKGKKDNLEKKTFKILVIKILMGFIGNKPLVLALDSCNNSYPTILSYRLRNMSVKNLIFITNCK